MTDDPHAADALRLAQQELDRERDLVQAIDAVLCGIATPADDRRVRDWRASSADHEQLWAHLQQLRPNAPGASSDTTAATDAAWQRMQQRLASGDEATTARTTPSRVVGRIAATPPRPLARAAHALAPWRGRLTAAAVLMLAIGWGSREWSQRMRHTAEAPLGQRLSVTLPDGSVMTLAAGSRASWPRRFPAEHRDVDVEGEAFFDVVHDDAVPFRVRVRDAVAEDVGTRFVVRGWPELAQVEVVVQEGVVALSDSAASRRLPLAARTHLRAGERGRLLTDGSVQVTPEPGGTTAWLQGELAFTDTPLREALPMIGRWYGVTLTADSTVLDRRLTARFVTQPLPQLLASLRLALGLRTTTRGSTITLTP